MPVEAFPVLQILVPTGKRFGPVAGLLLSSPTMFHVKGVAVIDADSVADGSAFAETLEVSPIWKAIAATATSRTNDLTFILLVDGVVDSGNSDLNFI